MCSSALCGCGRSQRNSACASAYRHRLNHRRCRARRRPIPESLPSAWSDSPAAETSLYQGRVSLSPCFLTRSRSRLLRRKVVIARHGDAAGYFEPQRFVPERDLVNHILEYVSSGVIPKESPVYKALRIEVVWRSFALELLPSHMLKIAVGRDGSFPSAVWPVAVMMGVDGGDRSHAVWCCEFTHPREGLATHRLHTHLHHAVRSFHRSAHASSVVRIKSHSLFLVDVLPCLHCRNEIKCVLMLGSGNEHGVNGLVVEQAAKIGVSLNSGSKPLGLL